MYYRLNLAVFIVAGIRTLFKGILAAVISLLLSILAYTCSYAADSRSADTALLKKYIELIEEYNQIPRGLLRAIAQVESGFNHRAINIDGRTIITKNKTETLKIIKSALTEGISNIDIGIAQINYRWHGHHFKSIEEMLDPTNNLEYAAKFLKALYKQHGSWNKAVRYYHSANPDYHHKYSRKILISWLGIRL